MIDKLRHLLTRRDKQFLVVLAGFAVFVSLLEMAGVSVIWPFIAVATDFSKIEREPAYRRVYEALGFSDPTSFVVAFGAALVVFYVARSLINLLYFHLLSRFSHGRYHLLAYRLFRNYLQMSYRTFIDRNASELSKAIVIEAQNLTALLSGLLLMMGEAFVVVFIYAMMLYADWRITLLLTVILALNAAFLLLTVTKRIKFAGEEREEHQRRFYRIIGSTLLNFKMVKLHRKRDELLERFSQASSSFSKSQIRNNTLSHVPRLFLEAVGFGIVVLIVIYLIFRNGADISGSMGMVSIFILGLYRLMPSANRIISQYNLVQYHLRALEIVHGGLMDKGETLADAPVRFEESIELDRVSFRYLPDRPVLSGVSLTIRKGETIAFVGESGSGKTTLIDLVIGLYRPLEGEVRIDGVALDETNVRQWRNRVGYIPQSVYLYDGTVAQNVAFSERPDREKVAEALKLANIYDFLVEHQDGLETRVGDGGIKLSGGQKQRIAIARALYDDPDVLVLDEATSSLDHETEARIMEEIYRISREKTLLIVAHRLSTISGCDRVFRIESGVPRDVTGAPTGRET